MKSVFFLFLMSNFFYRRSELKRLKQLELSTKNCFLPDGCEWIQKDREWLFKVVMCHKVNTQVNMSDFYAQNQKCEPLLDEFYTFDFELVIQNDYLPNFILTNSIRIHQLVVVMPVLSA